jgi:flagellar hook-basal body complex protein FliE
MTGFDLIGVDGGPAPRLVGERGGIAPLVREGQGGPEGSEPKTGFGKALYDALHRVDALQRDATTKGEALARGEGESVQDLMVAMGKSDVAFNLMLEVRNKIMDAWQTLTRTTI